MAHWQLSGHNNDHTGNGIWYYYKCGGNYHGFWSNKNYTATLEYNKTTHADNEGHPIDNDLHITAHIRLIDKETQRVSNHAVSYYPSSETLTAFPDFFPNDLKSYITTSLMYLSNIN